MNQRVRLGLNVYLWDGIWQDRFLAESLLPTVERIELETGPLALWFDRSDRRGPHVYSIVGCPRDSRELVEREITLDIGEYLAAVPADMDESLREMTELRHRACERMVFSKIDRLEGLASPASFALFVQPGDSYPVWYDSLLNETEAFWARIDRLSRWSIGRLSATPGKVQVASGTHQLVELDRQLRASGVVTANFWRFYCCTLFPGLRDKLSIDEAQVLDWLQSWAREAKNSQLRTIWSHAEIAPLGWPGFAELTAFVVDHTNSTEHRDSVLREVLHWAVKQLGILNRTEFPIVLFAWYNSLFCEPVPTVPA